MPLWSPMRHQVFEALVTQPDVYLKVFFEKESVRSWASGPPNLSASYEWDVIESYHPEYLKRFRLIPYRLPCFLRHFKPDIVIVVCLTQAVFVLSTLRYRNCKLILWTGESEHILQQRINPKSVKLLRRLIYPLIDGFGCYSKATMAFLNRTFAVPTTKIFQIPQCIENHHFAVSCNSLNKGQLAGAKRKDVILSIGRLIHLKGYHLLIAAWSNLPKTLTDNCVLRIAGEGPLRGNLEEQVRLAGLNSVEFIGYVEYRHLPFLYHNADIFILPSLEETWGFVVNEAMASGLPVLCSKYAHAREMLAEGQNGYLFDPLSTEDTVLKIMTLYEKRPQWKEMGFHGSITVNKYFTAEIAADAISCGINRLIKTDG